MAQFLPRLLLERETIASMRDRLSAAYRSARRHARVLGGAALAALRDYWRL
jgi:hypothetical protein